MLCIFCMSMCFIVFCQHVISLCALSLLQQRTAVNLCAAHKKMDSHTAHTVWVVCIAQNIGHVQHTKGDSCVAQYCTCHTGVLTVTQRRTSACSVHASINLDVSCTMLPKFCNKSVINYVNIMSITHYPFVASDNRAIHHSQSDRQITLQN